MRRSGVRISSQAPGQRHVPAWASHIHPISGTIAAMKGWRRRLTLEGSPRPGNTAVWELRVLAGRNPVTKKPRYVSRTVTGTAAAADAELAELVAEVSGGRHDGPDITFGSLLDRWLAHATTLKGLSPDDRQGTPADHRPEHPARAGRRGAP